MSHDYTANLSNLVRLGVTPVTLQVDPFSHAFLPEDVMTAAHPLDEPQAQQEHSKVFEAYAGIRPSLRIPLPKPITLHGNT